MQEAELLLSRLDEKGRILAFDERGKTPSSREFAGLMESALNGGIPSFAMLIGGPDGLEDRIREKADHVISFGKLTLPHQMVRIMVFEQLYRATTILTGHPYHRD